MMAFTRRRYKHVVASLLLYLATTQTGVGANNNDNSMMDSYCQDLQDYDNPDWYDLKATLQVGVNSFGPALGSTIQVVNQYATKSAGSCYGERGNKYQSIALHTPTHSYIRPCYFAQMSRWYQEDDASNTQIFRMFPGDDNVRNSREGAPRSEVFAIPSWNGNEGVWYEWSGRYTFVQVRKAAVFQIKHNVSYWSMQLVLEENADDGSFDLYYVKLFDTSSKTLLMQDVVGKGVDIRVLDNGADHKVYVDEMLMVVNRMTDRGEEPANRFRWGFYSPPRAVDRDILILVTGASVERIENGSGGSTTTVSWLVTDAVWTWLSSLFESLWLFGTNDNQLQEEVDGEPNATFVSEWYGNAGNDDYGYF